MTALSLILRALIFRVGSLCGLLMVGAAGGSLAAEAGLDADSGGGQGSGSRDFLYAWFHDPDPAAPSFLGQINVDPSSPDYGQVVRTIVAPGPGFDAHHTHHDMPHSRQLFANDFIGGRSHIFDLHDPANPRLVTTFADHGRFSFPHSFVELASGNVLATFQNEGAGNKVVGGLVEMTADGKVVRSASAADASVAFIRPYSLEVLPDLDRVVVTSADMMETDITVDYQVWRLSDLRLLGTHALPEGPRKGLEIDPMEARLLSDGKTMMITTYSCGLYLVDGLAADAAEAHFVHDFGGGSCGMPVIMSDFWVEAVGRATPGSDTGKIDVLDLSDPRHPRLAFSLAFPPGYRPHWIGADKEGGRLAVSGGGDMQMWIIMLDMDGDTGALTLDVNFGEVNPDGLAGINTDHHDWPHGRSGPAIPHALVFDRP